ncbi:hypothetical protein M6G53_00415 [Serratia nevei]|uniref:hypothetical protein n=1 Tax=Serratia nevei TaxID=2703794 RepID=UPI00209DD765|nr:hypothetical protein [Serratia nevei]MCP1103859.1 hypothetical protein [Serratia nevei]
MPKILVGLPHHLFQHVFLLFQQVRQQFGGRGQLQRRQAAEPGLQKAADKKQGKSIY